MPVTLIPMPVTEPDLEAAAAAYASRLPARFDLVHLGLRANGHTASAPTTNGASPQPDGACRDWLM